MPLGYAPGDMSVGMKRTWKERTYPFETYLSGLRDIVGLRPGAWERAREALYPQLPAAGR